MGRFEAHLQESMLKTLSIKNYALIDELTAGFSSGLVIITGETGAGKSIIVDAMGLILGGRASADVVRQGAEKAVVEGVFAATGNRNLEKLLTDNELAWYEELIVRREVSSKGVSRCFVNDTPVTLTLLKQVGELLVDLHGQHEHQSLLRAATHGEVLDEFGDLEGLVKEFGTARSVMLETASRLAGLRQRENSLHEKSDLLAFQIADIDAVTPVRGEEESLEAELRVLENAEHLYATTSRLYELLNGGDHAVHDALVVVRNHLQNLASIDREFEDAARECSSAEAIVSELAKSIQRYNARVEFNPERLEQIRERLGRLTLLKKKYGGSLDAVLAHREKIGAEIALVENLGEAIASLEKEVEESRKTCAAIARRLTIKRQEIARKLEKAVVAELSTLGIANGSFSVRIARKESANSEDTPDFITDGKRRVLLNARGADEVEFFISTNLGEEPKPLVKVASGGEVSRIMLALKSILARSDRLPVLVFDEIDVGVSGRIAQAVGLALKNLSRFHQVIAITHLPQIAGQADVHFVVEKSESGKRSTTSIRPLTADERVKEVAKLMSGAEVTEAGLRGARELMGAK